MTTPYLSTTFNHYDPGFPLLLRLCICWWCPSAGKPVKPHLIPSILASVSHFVAEEEEHRAPLYAGTFLGTLILVMAILECLIYIMKRADSKSVCQMLRR